MTETSTTRYTVSDALEAALDELRSSLLEKGAVAIAVHGISRPSFDRLAGQEKHFAATETTEEFWTKAGFCWNGAWHRVYVNYYTDKLPVVPIVRGAA